MTEVMMASFLIKKQETLIKEAVAGKMSLRKFAHDLGVVYAMAEISGLTDDQMLIAQIVNKIEDGGGEYDVEFI